MDLMQLMQSVNGASFISLHTVTVVPLLGGAKNEFKGRVLKHTVGASIMVFQNKKINGYEAMIKRRLEAEGKSPGSFSLSPRKWGTRLENMPIVEHEGNYYLEVIYLKPGKSHYEVDGRVVDINTIPGFKATPQESDQGGLDDKVIIRTYKFDSIKEITVDKRHYIFF